MQYVTVLTPDNIEIKYRLAGAGARLAAAVVDLYIQIIVLALFVLSVVYIFFGGFSDINLTAIGWGIGIIIAGFFIILFGYYLVFEIFFNGQTPGKILFGLRTIRNNGMPITFTHSLIRNIFKLTVDFLGVGLVFIMFSKNCKRPGDMAASTIVVSENTQRLQEGLNINAYMGFDNNNAAVDFGNFKLSRKETLLLKDYFNRRSSFSDGGESVKNAFILFFAKKFDVPEEKLTEDILLRILQTNI